MGVAYRNQIRPRLVNSGVQKQSNRIDRTRSHKNLFAVIHLKKVRHFNLSKRNSNRINPQQVRMFGVAHSHMAKQTFGKSKAAKNSTHARQPLKSVPSFTFNRIKNRWLACCKATYCVGQFR